MAMATSELQVERDGGAVASSGSGAPSAATDTSAVSKQELNVQARATTISVEEQENANDGDTAVDTTSGHDATKIVSDNAADSPVSDGNRIAHERPIERSTTVQDDDDARTESEDGEEHDYASSEGQSETPTLPIGSRGPQETLADYV